MTPKIKAEKLVSLFTFNCKECDNAKISRLFALFAVEQIISEIGFSIEIDYWNEVKKEIMKR